MGQINSSIKILYSIFCSPKCLYFTLLQWEEFVKPFFLLPLRFLSGAQQPLTHLFIVFPYSGNSGAITLLTYVYVGECVYKHKHMCSVGGKWKQKDPTSRQNSLYLFYRESHYLAHFLSKIFFFNFGSSL